MANWTYKCYDDGKSPSLWQRWYDDTPAAQGSFDAALNFLEALEVWQEPNARKIGDLIEIKCKGGGIQHRVFGFYSTGEKQKFIVLGFGDHKDRVYNPKDILKTCTRRRKEVEDDPSKAKDCTRPTAK
jgi:hypothetical protein